MSEKLEKNLAYAFAAESKASARNLTFARKAEIEGYPQIARLFRAVSEALERAPVGVQFFDFGVQFECPPVMGLGLVEAL